MYVPYHEGKRRWDQTVEFETQNLVLPPWLCQSYVRSTPEEHLRKVAEKQKENEVECNALENENKRRYKDADGNAISRKKMKKLRRIGRRPEKLETFQYQKSLEKCTVCVNPLGSKCGFKLCKKCCRDKCFMENLDCQGHRILVKTRREMAQFYAEKAKVKK